MKRVIFFGVKTFPSQGGTDRVAENLIRQLKDRFQITLYCYQDPGAANHIQGVEVIQFRPLMRGAIGAFFYFFMSALHIVFTRKAELIHLHKTDAAFFIPLLRLRAPVVATSHEAPYKRDKWNKLVKLYFHLVERIFIGTANLCTCISQPLTEYYQAKYRKNVVFIPNGINPVSTADFDYSGAKRFLPQGATLDEPFILFSARRIMRTKGCHTMLDALVRVGYTGQVFIAGELTHNHAYLEELRRIGNPLKVHYLGFVNPLQTLLAFVERTDLFIFPSETEGMSIMLLEVASAGRPIIASDIPENTQVFSGREVLYFKVSDANDLAEKIKFALTNRNEMEQLAKNCQKKVYTDYVWSNIANSYAEVYQSIMR
jgi:glycosyltransferase involved in cell wall biosynthesis